MADEPETEDETLELTEDMEVEQVEEPEGDDEHSDEPGPDDDGAEEETVVSWGDDDPDAEQPDDNAVMRELRKRNRELNTKVRELETSTAKPTVELGPKPTLESCDYDEEKFETELDAWKQRKADAEQGEVKAQEEQKRINEEWQNDLRHYAEKKAALEIPDADECEGVVETALNPVQQAVLLKAANNPALFMVALAKSPAKLAELSKMQDVIKLGAAIARMEGGIKVVKQRKAPNIDTQVRGAAKIPEKGDSEKRIAKLEKDLEAGGDRTELIRLKKQKGLM